MQIVQTTNYFAKKGNKGDKEIFCFTFTREPAAISVQEVLLNFTSLLRLNFFFPWSNTSLYTLTRKKEKCPVIKLLCSKIWQQVHT